jgi:5-methylcytosine-specific restriction endonuclease McrA
MGRPPKGRVIWADRAAGIVSRKTCPKCSRLLLPGAFGPDKRTATGLASWCNECIATKTRDIRANWTPERRAANVERTRRWREQHPEDRTLDEPTRLVGRGVDAVLRSLVFDLLGRECHCGATDDLTVDHVGDPTDNSLTNFQVLCRRCNSAKGETPVDYRNEFQRAVLRRFEDRASNR